MSEDGSMYVYGDNATPGVIHLVSVADGHDRVIYRGSAQLLLGLIGNTLYAADASQTGPDPRSASQTVYAIDVSSGSPHQLMSGGVSWQTVGNGFAFGTEIDPADPHPLIQSPVEPGMSVAPNRLWALRLSDGTASPWLYRPGSLVEVAGLDPQGAVLVVVVSPSQTQVLAVSDASTSQPIYTGPGHDRADPLGLNSYGLNGVGLLDSHGSWLSTVTGIVLYRPSAGFTLAFKGEAVPAGPCQ